ncbi:hypothetical protein Goari_024054 [Gossypium aridum]|uniref:Uncharacterized protein n=1 Tax=Gossypium aridum TaxID=34290 RepID=A0A7J8X4X1_GOSAI|nr:hypothetical protein [Gossypium aridum]
MRNVDYKRARHFQVDLSAFRNILEINKEQMIARVEPVVTKGQITRITVPMNLSLAVVADLDDLTILVSSMAMALQETPTSMTCFLILLLLMRKFWLLRC